MLLSLFLPGAGHFALGRWERGVLWLLVLMVVTLSIPITLLVGLVAAVVTRLAVVVDAARVAVSTAGLPSWRKVGLSWLALVLLHVISSLTIREYVVQAYTIPSGAMAPTLLVGDYMLVKKFAYRFAEPLRGDVIVFKYPFDERRDFVERVVGLPGEEVHLKGRTVYIDRQPLDEPYAIHSASASLAGAAYGPATVPPGSYFMLGDNRDNSQDSRYWGFLGRQKIRGKAFMIYWSWDRDQYWPRWERIGKRLD